MKKIIGIVILIILSSCAKYEETVEKENIKQFYNIKHELQTSSNYIRNIYLEKKNIDEERINIIPSLKSSKRKNIYYDSVLGNSLKKYKISVITCNKSLICGKNTYDIFFKIKPESNHQYYYVNYDCVVKIPSSESMNYKVVALDDNWSLETEKN